MDALNATVSQVIVSQRSHLAKAIVDRQWMLYPELAVKYGELGHAKCVQDVNYTLSFLAEAIHTDSPPLFNHYISWVKVLFAGLNIPAADLSISLEITGDTLVDSLPAGMGQLAAEYIEAGLKTLRDAPATQSSFINPDQPLGALAQRYLTALLRAERYEASQLILAEVEAGTPVKDIYLHVFQPSQHEIGRLWQTNQISVAQEHYCTAATQLIMSQLYPYIFATEKSGRRLVAACVGNELHEIGIRMVADFFEMEGWDTYYLGANAPASSVARAVTEQKADVLAISATMTFHISALKLLIEQVRATPACANVKIMVGGYPLNIAPNLWRQLNADGYAQDAQTAVIKAAHLIASGG